MQCSYLMFVLFTDDEPEDQIQQCFDRLGGFDGDKICDSLFEDWVCTRKKRFAEIDDLGDNFSLATYLARFAFLNSTKIAQELVSNQRRERGRAGLLFLMRWRC